MLRMMHRLRILPLLLAAGLLAGCLGELLQSKVDEPYTYMLGPQPAATASVAYDVEIAVSLPTALPALDTTRIALLKDGNRIDYVYGARWAGTAPQLVQNFMVTLLRSRQGVRSVVVETSRVNANYLLQMELRDFQAEYSNGQAPQAHVTLVATLVDIAGRRSLGTYEYGARVPAEDNRQAAIVKAFEAALQQAGVALTDQVATQLGNNATVR